MFPPIPTRRFDWCAYIDGEEEEGTCGYGESEQAALEELIEGELERSDSFAGVARVEVLRVKLPRPQL